MREPIQGEVDGLRQAIKGFGEPLRTRLNVALDKLLQAAGGPPSVGGPGELHGCPTCGATCRCIAFPQDCVHACPEDEIEELLANVDWDMTTNYRGVAGDILKVLRGASEARRPQDVRSAASVRERDADGV